jgi:hypothetical protein
VGVVLRLDRFAFTATNDTPAAIDAGLRILAVGAAEQRRDVDL